MHMRAATVLQFVAEPEVGGTNNTNLKSVNKLLDSMIEEPVGNHWVLLQGLAVARAGVRVIGADEVCKLWPLGRPHCV